MLTVVKSKPVCFPLSIYPVPAFPPFTCRLLLTICCWPAGPTQLQVLLQGQFAVCNERYTYTCVYLWPSVRVCKSMDWQRVCAFVLSCLDMDTARERSETGANCSRQRDLLWLHHSTALASVQATTTTAQAHSRARAPVAGTLHTGAAAPVSVVFYSNTVRCTFEHALRK